MFSKQLNLKSKKTYELKKERRSDEDKTITVSIQINSNHDIDPSVVSMFERDLQNMFVPRGYNVREKERRS